ncbi:MAG: 50S ribosomal protein L24 [Anaerosomatales bacterium]|uniref:50S ribosomal protein L24 n=1 Tax=Parvivirga hydrogeniphila TaxID=2939460 RepID=UPI0019A284BF|nr:50S ribosomal protein L24 [Parvivirga hydrogeniphila]MBC7265850.1 50S ribosomal protein L24 [Coriobacteriia bacterium]MCL4078546.1 50S ribosomal protein L24 [Parvivirga hydrogeniphila]MDI6692419.1 50S ribosomal protein L24 [Anaerosomatales bacterium]MDI6843563.1 50S ribosomal protein L24 [Anaerosomatales bacterium]
MTVRKGDKVRVIAGKDKGKEGKVLRAYPEKQRVVVENVHMIKKATRPSQRNPQGGIVEMEGTIHVSNVMLVCPNCGQPTRVGRRREDGVRIRVCKKCGKDIDK